MLPLVEGFFLYRYDVLVGSQENWGQIRVRALDSVNQSKLVDRVNSGIFVPSSCISPTS